MKSTAKPFSTRRSTVITVTLLTLLFLLAAHIFHRQNDMNKHARSWVVHTYEVVQHLEQLTNDIKDAEIGVHRYSITGDSSYLAFYQHATKDPDNFTLPHLDPTPMNYKVEPHNLPGFDESTHHFSIAEEMRIIRWLTSDNQPQQQKLEEIGLKITTLLTDWALNLTTLTMRDDALAKRNQEMTQLLDELGAMIKAEEQLLVERIALDESNTRHDNTITFAGLVISYIALLISFLLYQAVRKRAQKELVAYTQELECNQEELRAQQEALEKLITKLTESNTSLERFAYVASHDMQEPLRMIANFSGIIADEYDSKFDEAGKEYVSLVRNSALRMMEMVKDLLDYARVKNDQRRFVDVDAMLELRHVLQNLSSVIAERGAVVTQDILPHFHGNPVQFMRLLQNLIGNGLKYQPTGNQPKIHIGVEDKGNQWCFSVRDNGIGVASEHANAVFEPFKRLHTWDEYKGSGIGLAVCKQIVESHGGKIWMESAPGKGSVFYFTIAKNTVQG